jgi:hypothetical protein
VLGRPAEFGEQLTFIETVHTADDLQRYLVELRDTPELTERGIAEVPAILHRGLRNRFDEPEPVPGRPNLVFLHLMKTGGTSLSDLLSRWYPRGSARAHFHLDELALTPPPVLSHLGFIGGHIPFEGLDLIPSGFRSICVLRDPVSRTLSHLATLRANSPAHRDMSVEEFVSGERIASGNYQARQLAHTIGLSGAWISYSPENRCREIGVDEFGDRPLQALFDSSPLLMSEGELLEKAAANLEKIDFVSTTEHLDDLAEPLAGLLGRHAEPVPRLNRSHAPAPEISDRIRRIIERRTAVDRELHELALRRSQELRHRSVRA